MGFMIGSAERRLDNCNALSYKPAMGILFSLRSLFLAMAAISVFGQVQAARAEAEPYNARIINSFYVQKPLSFNRINETRKHIDFNSSNDTANTKDEARANCHQKIEETSIELKTNGYRVFSSHCYLLSYVLADRNNTVTRHFYFISKIFYE